ncbi:MAG: ABC transporter ATP-binding protein [bacterium]
MSIAIETSRITKKFTRIKQFRDLLSFPLLRKEITALQDVSLKVHKGEVFCLLGPNGAGKTTLIKILCTLMLPTEGKAVVNGLDVVTSPGEVRRAIGYAISDERSFYWRLTACQNLKFFGILNNIPAPELEQRIKNVLNLVDLEKKTHTPFKDFSLGMKQRMAIARALLTDPDILFMDEPTRSLDPASADSLRHFIREKVVDQQGKTVFLATHNLREVEEIGHRIAIIHSGKIKASGAPAQMQPVFERLDRYLICLKTLPSGFIEKIGQQMDGQISIQIIAETGQDVEVEIGLTSVDGKKKPEISDVIACMVNRGGKIQSCVKKEIPLYEIYSTYTKSEQKENEF